MGAEHSSANGDGRSKGTGDTSMVPESKTNRLQKRYTVQGDVGYGNRMENRPNSPPISVCSDSDLPYISYTDRIQISDSPKIRSKHQIKTNSKQAALKNKYRKEKLPGTHNIVVVKSAAKEFNLEMDPDFMKLQSIPMFLPVMRGSLSVPLKRDPEILDRLQPVHLQNMCCRMQTHFHISSCYVTNEQNHIVKKIKKVDKKISKLFLNFVELQKAYSTYAEVFSKTKLISQQLSRCNTFLNHNIASLEQLNNVLEIKDRMEPFVWQTSN
ncbi:BLOC-1-related complex subunit 5 [Condylostylus longicornis]|uniref:BLOC-1-related complex subunit 5 n=1 Tax=Condylostylus longicornis TaxID=2530218 RepID=UPI00244DB765|nr:BLOC-1-related complex subunit 5 [Condylostylus longicornis]